MITKTKILIGILIFGLISGSILFVLYILGIIPIMKPGPPILGEVSIFTDKTEYEQGKEIKITVRNNLEKPIWYVDFVQRDLIFWEIEKFKDNQWINPSGGFRLPKEENGKEVCYIKFYELPIGYVAELKPNSEFSREWNQKICREGGGSSPIFIETGRYRFTFKFGLNTVYYSKEQLEKEPWKRKVDLTDTKTIYSNEFTIKEKFGVSTSRNCDDYEMSMTEEEIQECSCPEGYQKFFRLSGAYCTTDSRKPCNAHTDCPKGEQCISDDRKNWFCTGQFAGCYYRNPENSEEPMLCAD